MSNRRESSAWEPNRWGSGQDWRGLRGQFKSVTQAIIVVSGIVFLIQFLAGLAGAESGLVGLLGLSQSGLGRGYIWQPLSYMFLHGSFFHILFNLLALWFLGREVEHFIGPKPYAWLYFVSGLIGGLFWLVFNPYGWLIGASAGVLGCVIAFATLFPERELTLLVFFVLPVRIKAKYLAVAVVLLEVFFELGNRQVGLPRSGVAHLAHLGGAAAGYLFIKALGYGSHPRWVIWLQQFSQRLGQLGKGGARGRPGPRGSQSVEDYLREEIDPILDKISREGMHSLTRQERKTLESARDLMDKHRR